MLPTTAAIIFTDGEVMGASLDRNGFRPSRYYITNDDFLILSSETGALKIDESRIKAKKRLEHGKLLLVDTKKGKLISDEEIKLHYANAKPYDKWLKNMVHLEEVSSKGYKHNFLDEKEILCLQRVFAWNYDELKLSVEAMASNGKEILAAMGVDTSLAVLSESYRKV